ncbi:hypothetical protein [Rhodobacter capsulatus]|uniref:hypothetical protein n=1 Tax=Rhodobacter capsulatus TaxID=1061 RepID=UPI004024D74B
MTKEIPGITCRPEGLKIAELWIVHELDLTAIDCERAINAIACRFHRRLSFQDAQVNGLGLSRSEVSGIDANRLICSGSVLLKEGFVSKEGVYLCGAKITGELNCSEGTFESTKNVALDCSDSVIGSHVFLDYNFVGEGEVKFCRARIAGNFRSVQSSFSSETSNAINCDAMVIGGDFLLEYDFTAKGKLSLAGMQISGDLKVIKASIAGSIACDGARIGGGFFWQEVFDKVEVLDLTETKVGRLSDDVTSWRSVATPRISGFRYDSIQSDMTVRDRLDVLARKGERAIPTSTVRKDFDPQPYSHLAKVYDTMGHRIDANKVRLVRDWRLMLARLNRAVFAPRPNGLGAAMGFLSLFWSAVYWLTFGFGYAPFRALLTAGVIWGGTFFIADQTYQRGEFAPASPVVLASPEWLIASAFGCPGAQEPGCTMPLRRWEQSVAYRDYETFSPALYALDLFLPLDTLAQEESWAPSKDRGPWGWTLYWGRWLIQLSGWLLLTTAAAVFSGVLGKKD